MKNKNLLTLSIITVIVFSIFLNSCGNEDKEIPQGFVYIEDNVFKIDGHDFFPLMINYKVDVRMAGDDVVISPALYYDDNYKYESFTKDEMTEQFYSHMELMRDLGFNTVRLCIDVIGSDENGRYYPSSQGGIYLKDKEKEILDGIEEALSIADSLGMKVMLLLKPPFDREVQDYIIAMLKYFSDNPTIFAYDFMNEPLYFDTENHNKKSAVEVVTKWRNFAKKHAPHHLFTIGFSEPIEVFEWDPSMIPVDFVQIHTYHPLRIPNEIWWYSNYCGKPWIIGEISLPADNDSITYEQQAYFVKEAYQYVIDCGGIGFGWWEFQDHINPKLNFEANYSGLLNHEGVTKTKSGKEIKGTLKPAALEFIKLSQLKPKNTHTSKELRRDNYFNMLGYENYVVKGKITNDGKPVEGAAIRGWNQYWIVGMNTFSDENGEFTLYSNDSCMHFEISAPSLENVKFGSEKLNLKYQRVDGKSHDFSDLENVALEYHKISYFPFLKNDSTLLDFKPEMFNKAKFAADMGTIELKKI